MIGINTKYWVEGISWNYADEWRSQILPLLNLNFNNLYKIKKILADLNKHISRFESQDSEYVAQYDQCLEKAIMPRNVCFPPSVIEFEGKKYSAPHDIKEYLRIQYGDDYMTLPPVSKRQTHEPIKLEF